MYKKILGTVFQGTMDEACRRILEIYRKQEFCIVDYLYFANISAKKLFAVHHNAYPIENFREALLQDYKKMNIQKTFPVYQQAIFDADMVLMDGIALQIFYFLATRKRLDNLNGTDFCPYLLSYIKQCHPGHMNVLLYGTYPHLLERTEKLLISQGYNVVYAQDGYTNIYWDKVDLALKGKEKDINVLLIARSTPDYPMQELWSLANKDRIRQCRFIVMNQAGTFDFWVGEQKRAPKLIRLIRLERLRRLVSDPKRNIKKVVASFSLFSYIFSYLILKKR